MADPVHADEYDVVVVGSGAGGLSAALAAARRGLQVIVLEKAPVIGGTTAFSGGVVWVPSDGSAAADRQALEYIAANAGNYYDAARAEAYVGRSREAVDFVSAQTGLKYSRWSVLDYNQHLPGAESETSPSYAPGSFNARKLGKNFALVRRPLETFTILGGMMIPLEDQFDFMNFARSWRSFRKVMKIVLRYAYDRATVSRATLLTGGNALVGALFKGLLDAGVPVRVNTDVESLVKADGRVVGVKVRSNGVVRTVGARHGVVLACGGFPHDKKRQDGVYPHDVARRGHRSLAPTDNVGDGVRMGEAAGAMVVNDLNHPAAWAPASAVPMKDGRTVLFPHFSERGKAGTIIVDRRGQRFVNEALSYMTVGGAMVEATRNDDRPVAYIIADHTMIRRDGLGPVPPAPAPIGSFIKSGYLKRAATVAELAAKLGIDATGLVDTVTRFNKDAEHGEDPAFHRGSDVYQLKFGTPGVTPNPCVAPLAKAPFYGIEMQTSDLGTFVGLRADEHSRVLTEDGQPIGGLYVAGNDMASTFGGTYPGAGITIGPALTFGYLAAEHIAAEAREQRRQTADRPASLSVVES